MINTRAAEGFNIALEIQRLWTEIRALHTAQRLPASTLAAGSIDVVGGEVTVRGGGIAILENGYIGSKYPSGRTAFFVGPFVNADGALSSTGMRLERDVDAADGDMIMEAMEGPDGLTHIYNGLPGSELDQCRTWANNFTVDATTIYLVSPATSTDPANVVLDANGQLRKIGSAAGLKLDIRPLDVAAADVLRLEPVTWLDKGQVERGEPTRRITGFVAEQVAAAAVEAPALAPLVLPGPDGVPAGVAYERVPAAQQVVLVDHDARLVDVEVTVAELRQENAALRGELAELRALVETLTATPKEAP